MKPQDYIKQELEKLKNSAPKATSGDLADQITRLTLTKKFRKYSLDAKVEEHIRNSMKLNVENNEPIKFVLPFGGYKLWRLKETPETDWAELFAMMYYTKWLKPICEIYEPGAWFDFSSDSIVVQKMNNIPKEDTDAYTASFQQLLRFIKPYQPKNFDMTLTPVASRYASQQEFDQELDKNIGLLQSEIGGLPKLDEAARATVELNVKTTPEQIKDPAWREKVFLIHEAYGRASKRRPYYRTPEKIMVVATPLWGSLCVGTTKDSIAKFWCGAGALKRHEEGCRQLVLSPTQLENTEFSYEPINIKGLDGKNFNRIRLTKTL